MHLSPHFDTFEVAGKTDEDISGVVEDFVNALDVKFQTFVTNAIEDMGLDNATTYFPTRLEYSDDSDVVKHINMY